MINMINTLLYNFKQWLIFSLFIQEHARKLTIKITQKIIQRYWPNSILEETRKKVHNWRKSSFRREMAIQKVIPAEFEYFDWNDTNIMDRIARVNYTIVTLQRNMDNFFYVYLSLFIVCTYLLFTTFN